MRADETSSRSWTSPSKRLVMLVGVTVIVVAILTQVFGDGLSIQNFGVLSLSSLDVFSTTKDDEAAASTIATTPSEIWESLWDKMGLPGSLSEQQQQQLQGTNNVSLPSTLTALGASVEHLGLQELFDVFPSPIQPEIIQIYNQTTYQDLVGSLVAVGNKNSTVAICANGGSVSAGGGGIALSGRYFSILARYLRDVINHNEKTPEARARARRGITVINRAHGTRHSLHTAVFAPSHLPYNTDLLLWEFSINDFGYHIPEATRVEQERSILLAWLREVEKIKPQPPKVILIYLWRASFSLRSDQRVNNPVFASHEDLARQFDFVVGHVNLGSYLDEQGPLYFDTLKRVFLADLHHPNHAGHSAIAFLLMNLLRGTGAWSSNNNTNSIEIRKPKNTLLSLSSHPHDEEIEAYDWRCGNETKEKRFLQSRIESWPQSGGAGSTSGWRSPLGAMTLEEPQNEPGSRPRQLILDSAGPNVTLTILGKQDPLRNDRQVSIAMECCRSSSNDAQHNNDALTTIRLANVTEPPMQGVQAIFFGFGVRASEAENIKVYLKSLP
jgi:hypothetical protein